MPDELAREFLIDPTIHFLNHGSFGACPKPVFEVYQAWQRRLENQPVLFLGREYNELDRIARQALADYLHTAADNLAFITNATQGVNVIARSLDLQPGDQVLATSHEYGACDYTWEFICKKSGATYLRQPVELPVRSPEAIEEAIWRGVTPATRVIFLSHIASPTALIFPVEAICRRAREAGILTVIDGAHAPGQIELDLESVGADWYLGNCHKWMLCPKGAGFLYARPEVQHLVEPLVVSWGYHTEPGKSNGSQFQDYMTWTGTKDPAAAFSVPAAIKFMQAHDWLRVRQASHDLLRATLQKICSLFEMEPVYSFDSHLYAQMGAAPLPPATDLAQLKTRLYDVYRVEVPVIDWEGRKFLRISVQGYNTQADLDALYESLQELAPVLNMKK